MFRGVVVRRRSLNCVCSRDGLWHRFDLERLEAAVLEFAARESGALVQGQELEFQEDTREERENR
jgi:hypothetical protein